jgi:peptidoglycan/LPS O-acetylase OafA/YrhL
LHSPSKITARYDEGPTAPADLRGQNSYDFIRFFAACCVLFSHHFDLAGLPEPKVPALGEDFGELGVEIFFCLSGFLICLSLQRSRNWAHFLAARLLRIFPNLFFVLVVTSAVTLLWYGNGAHLSAHIRYVADNLVMFVGGVTFTIPGVFTDTVRPAVNEPLWTLPYELWCYALIFLMFTVRRARTIPVVVSATLLVGIAWSVTSQLGEPKVGPFNLFDFFRLCSYFLSGTLIALFWPHLEKHALAVGAAGLFAAFAARNLLPLDTLTVSLGLAAAVIGFGHSKAMAWFSKGGDASYGMYVFAWPVQQFCHLLIGSFWLSMLAAFLITTAIGYGTWHGFERRALSYRKALAARLQGAD